MECTFQAGDRVTCLINLFGLAVRKYQTAFVLHYWPNMPGVDEVYTVREVYVDESGEPALRLVELVNPLRRFRFGVDEGGWKARWFRPVPVLRIERKQEVHA